MWAIMNNTELTAFNNIFLFQYHEQRHFLTLRILFPKPSPTTPKQTNGGADVGVFTDIPLSYGVFAPAILQIFF